MQRYRKLYCQLSMKQLLLFIFSITFLMSCKKDKFAESRQQIAGSWEFNRFIGYPFNAVPLPRGNGRIIVIGTDGSFERRSHDTTTFRGSYTLEEKKDCYGDYKSLFFTVSDQSSSENIISARNDTLMLSTSNCLADGGVSIYLRN